MNSNIMTTTDGEQPYFDFELQRSVTVSVGQTGFLHCRVEQLGDKDVSINELKCVRYFCLPNSTEYDMELWCSKAKNSHAQPNTTI